MVSAAATMATQRLFAPRADADPRARPRFALILLVCVLLHAVLLAILLILRDSGALPPPPEEIPVEVLTEPPPPQPQQQPEQKPQEPPPPPPQEQRYEKEATDAPREANKETLERETPDKETKAPEKAPPKDVEKPDPRKEKQAPQDAKDDARKADAAAAPKSLEEKLDAETIENAEQTPKTDDKQGRKQEKAEKNKGETRSISEQVAALTQLPDYEFGALAKPSPVGGGNAKATYLSILYGIIMPRMRMPTHLRAMSVAGRGVVVFYIDEVGHLVHQAVARSSGAPELDNAAIAAIRASAPFPPPPPGHPRALQFTYSPK